MTAPSKWRRLRRLILYLALLVCAAGMIILYARLLEVIPSLIPAERSFSEEVIDGAEMLSHGTCLEVCESLNLASAVRLHRFSSVVYLLTVLGLFVIWGLTLLLVAGQRSLGLGLVAMVAGATFLVVMVVSPALLSGDVYSYIMYGRMAAIYGGDPYTELPASYSGDPFLKHVFWANDPTYYGPLWTLVSRGLVLLGGEQVGLTVLVFRCLGIVSTLITAALVWWSMIRHWPERAVQALVFFLWNPLVVLELALSAHNEALMLVFVAAGIAFMLGRRYALGSTALVLSVLVKIVAAPLLPLYVVAVLRLLSGIKARALFLMTAGLLGSAATAGTLVAANAGPEILSVGSLGVSADRYQNSLHELAFNWLRQESSAEPEWAGVPADFQPYWLATHAASDLWSDTEQVGMVRQWSVLLALAPQKEDWIRIYELASGRMGYVRASAVGPLERPDTDIDYEVTRLEAGPGRSPAAVEANSIVRLIGWSAFGLVGLVAAWWSRGARSFLVCSTIALLGYYWLAAAWIWPWYITWALVPAALITDSRVAVLVALLSATVLTIYPSRGFEGSVDNWIFVYRSIPAFVPPLVLWAAWVLISWLASLLGSLWARIRRPSMIGALQADAPEP